MTPHLRITRAQRLMVLKRRVKAIEVDVVCVRCCSVRAGEPHHCVHGPLLIGLGSIEHRMDLLHTGVVEGEIGLARWVEVCSTTPARLFGLYPRKGVIAPGSDADIVVYDMEELAIDPPWIGEAVYDLPGDEWRRVQRAKGYDKIIVNGEITFDDGECTDATPGKLLRHGRG